MSTLELAKKAGIKRGRVQHGVRLYEGTETQLNLLIKFAIQQAILEGKIRTLGLGEPPRNGCYKS